MVEFYCDPAKKIRFGMLLLQEPCEGETLNLLWFSNDGPKTIRSSKVLKFTNFNGRLWIVETQNTLYVLKNLDEE